MLQKKTEIKSFEEKLYGDIWTKEYYLNWMYENLMAIKEVMSERASIYVHLDQGIGHYIKVLMDEIFGEKNYRNEIIWSYSTLGRPDDRFAEKHDNIFCYGLCENAYFNVTGAKVNYSEEYINSHFNDIDENGRKCRKRFDAGKWRIYYPEDGMIPNDVWEIPYENSMSSERVDYPTQKPIALIEKIIKASSNENMIVADFFGGSGTTAISAYKNKRKFIHVDVGINSIETLEYRLKENGVNEDEYKILQIQDGVSLFRNPVQTMEKLEKLIKGYTKNDTLGDFFKGCIMDSINGLMPVYLPNLMITSSNEKLFDNRKTAILCNELSKLPDINIKKVIVYYVDIIDMETINKQIIKENNTDIQVEFRDLKDILDDVVLEDHVDHEIIENTNDFINKYILKINNFISDAINEKIKTYNEKTIKTSKQSVEKITSNLLTISDNGLELIEYVAVDYENTDGIFKTGTEIKIDEKGLAYYGCRKYDANGNKIKAEKWNYTIKCTDKPKRLKVRNICGDETIVVL